MRKVVVGAAVAAVVLIVAGLALGLGSRAYDARKTVVPFSEVPPERIKAAEKEFPGVRFDQAFREPNGNLELRGRTKSGQIREVEFDPSGKIVDEE